MTTTIATDTAQAQLIHSQGYMIDFNDLIEIIHLGLKGFGLTATEVDQHSATNATVQTGPIGIMITLPANDPTRIALSVERIRDSEALHPQAHTAILAEILSLLAEEHGAESIDWNGTRLEATRFLAGFIPLHRRGGATRITPRRITRTDTIGTPITFKAKPPVMPEQLSDENMDQLRQAFTDLDKEDDAPTHLSQVSAWAATASVGAMNPVIGVPLVAYNLIRGADIRVSTQAFALTASLTGVLGPMTYLPFF